MHDRGSAPERSRPRTVVTAIVHIKGVAMAEPSRQSFSRSGQAAAESADTIAAAVRDAKANFDETVDDLGQKGRQAVQGAKDVWSALGDALQNSIRTRPYTTLAMAGFIGFLYGATRRR
jgi:ElaB/YqjD/DUF883 family membrane-anchored ribosome-binding protein